MLPDGCVFYKVTVGHNQAAVLGTGMSHVFQHHAVERKPFSP
jgi:hypothetical protein